MTLFRLIVWRHLLHEPLRTIITVLGVGLGVAVYVAVATANIEVLRTFEEGVLAVSGRTTLQITSAAALPGGFDETVIETIRQADGVALAAASPGVLSNLARRCFSARDFAGSRR